MPDIIRDPHLPMVYIGGQAIPTGKRGVTAAEMMEGMQDALLQDYEGDDPKKFGLSKKQAMEKELADQAADGNLSAISMLQDRILGKPVQQVQSLNVTTSLKDFLLQVRQRAEANRAREQEAPF